MADVEKITAVIDYLDKIPVPEYFKDMPIEDKNKAVFGAIEEINGFYPDLEITPRMAALQTLYNVEGEEEGFAVMRRQDVEQYEVKDVKATLKRSTLAPAVQSLIDSILEKENGDASGGFGWLV